MYSVRHEMTDDIKFLAHFLQDLYKVHITTKSPERKEYFRKFALFYEILFMVLTILYISAVFIFIPFPIYEYYTHNKLVGIIPLYFPGIDEQTMVGYMILILFQALIMAFGVAGFLSCDYFFCCDHHKFIDFCQTYFSWYRTNSNRFTRKWQFTHRKSSLSEYSANASKA